MTLNDLYPHFQGHAILWRWISQKMVRDTDMEYLFFSYAKYDETFCCWQPLDVELHDAQSQTYGSKPRSALLEGFFLIRGKLGNGKLGNRKIRQPVFGGVGKVGNGKTGQW